MNQAALQTEPTPAQRLADKILARTNNGRDLIDLMHDIAQGGYDANECDRITASKILFDRGYGKCPKQTPVLSQARPELSRRVEGPVQSQACPEPRRRAEEAGPEPSPGEPDGSNQTPDPAPETDDNDVEPAPYSIRGALRESPSAVPHKEPESPRLVNQIDNSLHESLGPAPSAHNPTTNDVEPAPYSIRGAIRESPEHENTEPSSLQSSIQDYIIEITNDGDTLVDVLMDIAYADPEDPKACPEPRRRIKPFHRKYADRILMDRAFGTDPTPVRSAADGLVLTGDYPEHKISIQKDDEDEPFDEEVWKEIIAELKQLEEDNNLPPDRPVPKIDYSYYLPPDDFDLTPCILVLVWDNYFKVGSGCGRPMSPGSSKAVDKRGSPHPSRIEPEQLPGPTKPASCKDGPAIRRRYSWSRR